MLPDDEPDDIQDDEPEDLQDNEQDGDILNTEISTKGHDESEQSNSIDGDTQFQQTSMVSGGNRMPFYRR